MDIKSIGFATLTSDQVDSLQNLEKEFNTKFDNEVYFLAFRNKK